MTSPVARACAVLTAVWLAGCAAPVASDEPSNAPSVEPSVASTPAESASGNAPSPSASASADAAAPGPAACVDAKLVWADALERLLLVNCFDQTDLASTEPIWAWDGTAWEQVDDDGPIGHVVTGVAWDVDRDVLVRYGGIPLPEQSCAPETWEWSDAGGWAAVEADPPPDACDHVELTWDPSSRRVLLVGGGRGQQLASGTWTWDGVTWTQVAEDGPDPRAHHGLVTDEVGGRVRLSGGLDLGQVLGDLWDWDGSGWEAVETAEETPGPRSHHGLAMGADGMLLVGGATSTSTFRSLVDETWLLADGVWTRQEGDGPSARGLPALGYDPTREVYVLHGGFDAGGLQLGDTWEWDGAWDCVAGC